VSEAPEKFTRQSWWCWWCIFEESITMTITRSL